MNSLEKLAQDGTGFRVAVANPPYQIEVVSVESAAEQKTVANVFQNFQELANAITEQNSLIYPGQRWINGAGKGLSSFGPGLINSPRLRRVVYFHDSRDVFGEVAIGDGITALHVGLDEGDRGWILDFRWARKNLYATDPMGAPGATPVVLDPRQRRIVEKVGARARELQQGNLKSRSTAQKTFGLESNFVELNPHLVRPEAWRPDPHEASEWVRALLNDAAGKGGRAQWYWLPLDQVRSRKELVPHWKVTVSSMNCVGARGTGHSPLAEVLEPGCVFGRSRLALATFTTELEARNFFKLVSTPFYRFLYGALGDSQTLLGSLAPDLQEYGEACRFDCALPLDELHRTLCEAYGLSSEESSFMEEWVSSHLSPFGKKAL